jgi:thymidylate synthase
MKQYQALLRHILDNGTRHEDRTGVGTISVFGYQTRFDLREGFPIVTTKRVPFRWVAEELFWFLQGSTNETELRNKGVDIWQEWADENGDLGPVYGSQWRHWGKIYDIEPRVCESSQPEIETAFVKEIKPDFSSNYNEIIGKEFDSATGKFVVIKEYKIPRPGGTGNRWEFDVKFVKTGFVQKNCTKQSIINGQIRDRYFPSSYNIGCLGESISRVDYDLLYQTWHGILSRCYDKKHIGYSNYGGKGVFVCNRWLIFSNFVEDVKKIPNWLLKKEYPKDYSLDKDFYLSNCYSPNTCIWLSKNEQNLNTSKVSLIEATNPEGKILMRMGIDTLCNEWGFKSVSVKNCLDGKQETHHGWKFRYKNEIKNPRFRVFDQIKMALAQIKHESNSRRIIVSAWNTADLEEMALQPCHSFFQFKVDNEKTLHCQLYQRSADAFLGVPFNISSYALLTHLIAHVCGLEVGEFIHTFGDLHIYSNHVEQVEELLSREPFSLPKLEFVNAEKLKGLEGLLNFNYENLNLIGYKSHKKIAAPVAV